jgi:hypothetical protein
MSPLLLGFDLHITQNIMVDVEERFGLFFLFTTRFANRTPHPLPFFFSLHLPTFIFDKMMSNSFDVHGGAKTTKLPGSGNNAILYTESIDSLRVL